MYKTVLVMDKTYTGDKESAVGTENRQNTCIGGRIIIYYI